MSEKDLSRGNIALVGAAVIIILTAIGVTTVLDEQSEESFSKVISVGPVWNEDSWICTSDKDFMIYATLRGLGNSQIAINISDVGTQSLYSLEPEQMETFSVGAEGDHQIIITRTGTVTGFLVMQTASDATASCTQS